MERIDSFRTNISLRSTKSRIPKTSILKLAKQRKFAKIEAILTRHNGIELNDWINEVPISKKYDCGLHVFKGITTLHSIMVYRPTEKVVSLLIQRIKEIKSNIVPEDATDMQGRTPLHIAVANGCDISVIKRLMNGVSPVATKDAKNRLPLHWACTNPHGFDNGSSGGWACHKKSHNIENMTAIVETLVSAYPHSVTIEDSDGMTPLDLAIQNGADKYIRLLLDCGIDKNSKAGNTAKSNSNNDHSNKSATDSSSLDDLPMMEVFNTKNNYYDDSNNVYHDDDISSIGTGGVSTMRCYGKRRAKWPKPYVHQTFQL